MSVHGTPRNICPYCLKRFESRQGVKAHQRAKKHRVIDRADDAHQRKALIHYDQDKRTGLA